MIIPRMLAVREWGTWGSAQLRLDTPGVTFVRGRNLDDRGNPNRAGKSSLYHAGYGLLFGEHQLDTKKRSMRRVANESTRVRIALEANGHPVVADLHGTRLSVSIDGHGVQARRGDDEMAALRRVIGITPELWSATVHVNGVAGNPLLRNTSRVRCEFLERAFDLDRWSDRYAQAGDALVSLRRAAGDLETVRAELRGLPPPVNTRAAHAARVALEDAVRAARQAHTRASEELAVSTSLPPRPRGTSREYEARLRRVEAELRGVVRDAGHMEAWQEAHERHGALSRRIAELPRDSRLADMALEGVARQVAEREAALKDVLAVSDSVPDTRRWYVAARAFARRHGIRASSADDLLAMSRRWAESLGGNGTLCPVCGNDMHGPVDEQEVVHIAELALLVPRGLVVLRMPEGVEALRRAVGEGREFERRVREAHKARAQRRDLEAELRGITVPPRPRDTRSEAPLRQEADRLRDYLYAAQQWERVRHVPREPTAALRERVDSIAESLRASEDKLRRVGETIAEGEAAQARRQALEERVARLEDEAALLPVWRALHVAYSPTGMRLWLLGELLEVIVSGLNDAGRHMRDKIEFGYKLGRNRDLALTASNARGTFDVRLLSGAEGNVFTLLLLSVLLPLLPAARRCSLLVLDEVDANCSDMSVAEIAREHLPRLAETVPCLHVITPRTPSVLGMPDAREIVIEKRGSISRIVS